MMPCASTPKSTTPFGISNPFSGLSLPMLLRNLPVGSKRRIARPVASPASTSPPTKPMAVTRPSSASSRQVWTSFPTPSKISIWRIWPVYTAPSPATATECTGWEVDHRRLRRPSASKTVIWESLAAYILPVASTAMPRNDVPNWPGPAPLPPMTATCRYCIALASLSSLVWGRTPVLRPVLQNGPRRPEERALEDPRRPGGLPHKLCSIPNLGKTKWHHKSPLPSKVEADHFSQIPQDQLAVRQRHRRPDFLPGENLRAGDLVIRRGAGLDQP